MSSIYELKKMAVRERERERERERDVYYMTSQNSNSITSLYWRKKAVISLQKVTYRKIVRYKAAKIIL